MEEFPDWLERQKERADLVGQFAREAGDVGFSERRGPDWVAFHTSIHPHITGESQWKRMTLSNLRFHFRSKISHEALEGLTHAWFEWRAKCDTASPMED
jgi:hypothetical protein